MTGDISFNTGQVFPGVLPVAGGTMTGDITFNTGQLFPGTVTSVNGDTGSVTITATDLSALPTAGGTMTGDITFNSSQSFPGVLPLAGGTLTGTLNTTAISATGDINTSTNLSVTGSLSGSTAGFSGEVTSVPTTDSSGDNVCATKAYVLTKFGAAGNGTVTSVGAGNGIQTSIAGGADITGSGSLSIKLASSSGLIVDANGLKVDQSALTSDVTSVNSKTGAVVLTSADVGALALTGGTMTGDITFNSGQVFPGVVDKVNNKAPDGNGDVVLSASDVDAVSKATGGTFGGAVTVTGNVTATKFIGDGSETDEPKHSFSTFLQRNHYRHHSCTSKCNCR
jgi:hypothetical protein